MAFITQVQSALAQGIPFSVNQNSKGEWKTEKLSWWSRIIHWADRDFHRMRIDNIARAIFDSLRQAPTISIDEAQKSPALNIARKFLRQFDFSKEQTFAINQCSRQLLASKLGLKLELFEKNIGFEDFAFKCHLERYLMDYKDKIHVDTETGEISLRCKGKHRPWKEVKEKIDKWQEPEKNFPENPRQKWYYGNDGVQKKDMYAWKTLEPYKVVKDHDWGNKYIFEFCACCGESVQLQGDHSWLELKTPKGEIYSVGLYRPGKTSRLETYQFPMRVKKGYLMSPDVSIWWPTSIYRIPVEITREQFYKIKQSIEEDKQNEETRCFQLFEGNCQQYVNAKAAIAGIKLPTECNVLRHITPVFLQKGANVIYPRLPRIAQKVCDCVAAFFINLLQWALGAMIIDKALQKDRVCIKKHITSFKDLFDPSKLMYHPPRHLALVVKKEIEAWRGNDPERRFALPE